jgi:hypothetical protein
LCSLPVPKQIGQNAVKPLLIGQEKSGWNFLARASALSSWSFAGFFFGSRRTSVSRVEMMLLDTKLEVIPFFVARAIVCILRIEA